MKSNNKFKEVILQDFDKKKNLIAINKKIRRRKTIKIGYIYSFVFVLVFSFVMINILNKNNVNLDTTDYIYINLISENIRVFDRDFRLEKISLSELLQEYNIENTLKLDDDNLILYKRYASSIIGSKLYNEVVGYEIIYDNVNIFLSEVYETKPRDIEIIKSNVKSSKINNIDLIIYKYDVNYIAHFKIDNVYYDMEIKSIEENKLIKMIKDLIKVKVVH